MRFLDIFFERGHHQKRNLTLWSPVAQCIVRMACKASAHFVSAFSVPKRLRQDELMQRGLMSRSPSNFRQEDISRAINAAKRAALDVVRVEVDPKGPKIVLVVKEEGNEKKIVNSNLLPTPWSARKRKAQCASD
jgi:hypothetical protein